MALRARAESVRASRQRYPEKLRTEIVDCLSALRAAGACWNECKERLGVCKATLRAWRKNSSSVESSAIVRVKVTQEASPAACAALVLRTPNGNQLSGFNLADAVELLRVLG